MVMLIWLCPRISITTRGAHADGGEERRRTVPGVVKTDDAEAGGGGDAGEGAVEVPRLDGPTARRSEDVSALRPLVPRLGPLIVLPHPVPPEGRNAHGGQRYGSSTAPLGIVVVQDPAPTLSLLADVENAVVQVHVGPAEADQLTPAQPHGGGEDKGRTKRTSAESTAVA